ncbi:unnamed protein product (macronuclear) [Paramecium tetraurelia]|uniref:Protein kinase domain-containing protein n=1 Tax=Paramecium tetraurelia TaxID=5888 RepID=A0DI84_PARTE|nr:uncharacterized protein GSPATT00017122001 [Paramecium tetraurelia]CAK82751.1 unnamed protein product [Paramecium tetraurelia]|eukprot:XP_001450148.1 hypothetical protein (macronuclear) [Paramecium tetraurelia strain d4-2]
MNNYDYTRNIQNKYVINLRKLLGQGSYAEVHLGYYYQNEKQQVAIKSFDKKSRRLKEVQKYINRERQNQLQLQSPYVVKMIDFVEDEDYFYFILEYCEQGNLQNKINTSTLTHEQVFDIFYQIVQGYKEIRNKQIVHRDLKPENILFSNGIAKIGDFGFSKLLDELDQNIPQSNLGTPLYVAPEVMDGNYSSKADIWSLGVILYKMLYGKTPLEMQPKRRSSLQWQVYYPEAITIPKTYLNLLQRMLIQDPKERIEWEDIFQVVDQIFYEQNLLRSQIRHSTEVREISALLQDNNTKVKSIFNYFLYISDIIKFIRQLMKEVQEISQIVSLSTEQQLSYSVITQKYMVNELKYYIDVLQGKNMFWIQILPADFKLFKESDKYDQTLQNFQSNYQQMNEPYNKAKKNYEQFQQSSIRMSTDHTNQILTQVQFKLPNNIVALSSDQNDQAFGQVFNQIYHNIIEHIRMKLNIQAIQDKDKKTLRKILIKLLYTLQPLQFSHRIFEPSKIEQKLLNEQNLENEFQIIYAKCGSQKL